MTEAKRGRPTRLFLYNVRFLYNDRRWAGDAAIKKFVRGGSGDGSFSRGMTFVDKRRNPVGGWLNVHDFAGVCLLVLNEVIARKTWVGGDGSGDRQGDCRNNDVRKSHGLSPRLGMHTRNIQPLDDLNKANLARLPMCRCELLHTRSSLQASERSATPARRPKRRRVR